ncbi:hypothetical protein RB195_015567 [Necator americanus]|uniref:Uncharacterized protein n=1 Tax=Necator americanus TaxID=51031 RepID=A0ABR1E595_NECAM
MTDFELTMSQCSGHVTFRDVGPFRTLDYQRYNYLRIHGETKHSLRLIISPKLSNSLRNLLKDFILWLVNSFANKAPAVY